MATQKFTVTGLGDMIRENRRLSEPPSFRTIATFEQILARQFAASQAVVHVITDSLRQSGKTASEFDGNTWSGSITYGGPSSGPITDVTYALAEASRKGAHYRFLGIFYDAEFTDDYHDAIKKHFKGTL